MAYTITNYSKEKAKEYNVIIKPSKKKNKKIDVYKDNRLIASIGAKGFSDYPTYMLEEGKEFADTRRKLYKQRHQKDRLKRNTPGFWADKILW